MAPASRDEVHKELARILDCTNEEELHRAYIIVDPGRHRLRRVNPANTGPEEERDT